MNLDHCRPMQCRPFQFGKLFLSKPKGAPEGARKHIQISANAVTHHVSYGSNYFHVRGQGEFGCRLRSYGFQSEPGRRRSAMRKSMTRRRSSTRPSSKSARHRGPTSGSCSTRIGVMARSSGTTIATPAPHRRNARMSLVNSGGGGEESYRRWSPARGRRWRRHQSPCRRMRGSCSRGGRRRWPAAEREGSGFRGEQGLDGIWERERERPGAIGGRIRAWRRRRQRRLPWQCSSSTNCASEVEGAAE